MPASLPLPAMVAAIALCVAPAISSAQAQQTKACKDGTISSRSHFACLGHGGVDATRATDGPRAARSKHQSMAPIQAGEPRSKHTRTTTHEESKTAGHHVKVKHHDAHTREKQQAKSHRKWWPWGHKKDKEKDAKKGKKHENATRLPVPERPNGQPRAP